MTFAESSPPRNLVVDSYVQLLYPTPASPFAATLDAKDNGGPNSEEIISANDLIPLETKRELVLAFEKDLIEVERLLRDVELLEKRDVAGAGELAGEWKRWTVLLSDEFI